MSNSLKVVDKSHLKRSRIRELKEEDYPVNIRLLFFHPFDCYVPAIALRSIRDIRERGVVAIQDEETTAQVNNSLVETSLSINRLFMIWRMGTEPIIKDERKTLDIFTIVTDHIRQWVSYLNVGVQISDPPIEDLIMLDAFADKIYKHAKFERTRRDINYFAGSVKSSLGFDLSPIGQFRGLTSMVGLGQEGRDGRLFADSSKYAHEERHSFVQELSRLGGTHSQGMREFERNNVFHSLTTIGNQEQK